MSSLAGNQADEANEYLIAILALWAGDERFARERLQGLRGHLAGFTTKQLFEVHPVSASATRTLDQLNRRKTEYSTLFEIAGVEEQSLLVLASVGKHLGGAVWCEGDRNYELRAYLRDTSWEREFYESCYKQVGKLPTITNARVDIPYVYRDSPINEETSLLDLDLSWIVSGSLFIEVEVSDFGTLMARSTWTLEELPANIESIKAPFQDLLDRLDPVTAAESN